MSHRSRSFTAVANQPTEASFGTLVGSLRCSCTPHIRLCVSGRKESIMPKTQVPTPKSRTSGQSAQPGDKNSLPVETEKTADMVRDTVEPGEAMTGNQGV